MAWNQIWNQNWIFNWWYNWRQMMLEEEDPNSFDWSNIPPIIKITPKGEDIIDELKKGGMVFLAGGLILVLLLKEG